MPTNNNYTYAPAAVDTGAAAPAPIGPLDTAPAAVDPGPGLGIVPTTTRTPVIPQVELPVQTQLTPEGITGENVSATTQQRYITILENGTVVVTNASSLNFSGNVTVTASGTTGANIVLSGGGGNANAAGSNSQIQYNNNGSFAGSSGLTWDNGNGILSVTGNVFASSSGSFKGNTSTGVNALYAGTEGFTALGSNVIGQFTSNVNSYAQINFENVNNGNRASTDYVLTADNGTDSTYYVDLGIAGSNHSDPAFFGDSTTANDGYLYVVGNAQTGPAGGVGNLILGSSDGVIKMFVGNTAQANVKATVDSAGLSVTGNVRGGNVLVSGIASATGNITGGNVLTAGIVSATGNIVGNNIIGAAANIPSVVSQNLDVENISARGSAGVNIGAGGFNNLVVEQTQVLVQNVPLSVSGNVIGGNIRTGGIVSATANITGGNLLTGGLISATSTITSAANVTGGNVLTGGLISATANVTGGNVLTGGLISATANITGGNVLTGGLISATGSTNTLNLVTRNGDANPVNSKTQVAMGYNGTTDYSQFIHTRHNGSSGLYNTIEFWTNDGTQAGTFPANAILGLTVSNGNVSVGNSIINPGNTLDVGGNLYSTGNITGGNVLTGGVISATANITGGNVLTAGLISATSTITSAANITGGNILTGGLISATANITGGNVTTAGLTSTASLSITGNTATVTTANYAIGYRDIPQISLASNVTTALTDAGKHYYSVSASNLALTIANNTSVSWPVGTAISIVNRGTANITIAPASGVSLYLAGNSTSANRTVTTYGMATVMNVAANIWMINGTVV